MIPSGCNANCVFCYLKDNAVKLKYNQRVFLDNLPNSLEYIINAIGCKNPISIDITGNEPTYDVELLNRVLDILRDFETRKKVERVTITTNGVHLLQCIPHFIDVVDYVNISVHDFRPDERQSIMGCSPISDSEYKQMISELNAVGITVSATSVIHRQYDCFPKWRDKFIEWAKAVGFISVRFRCDVFWDKSGTFDQYMRETINDDRFTVIIHEDTPDSHWCRLRRYDGFRVFFLHGVRDTSAVTKGIEYVIDDDGLLYCDFYKRVPITDYEYEIGKIYDYVKG